MAKKKMGGMPKGRGTRPAKQTQPKKQEHRWTAREKEFVDAYMLCLNGARAARMAGYSPKTCYQIASENLRKPHIRAEVEHRLTELHMSANETLARLADYGRASLRPFTRALEDGSLTYDFSTDEAMDNLHLIKGLNITRTRRVQGKGEQAEEWEDEHIRLELHDAVHANELVGKAHKLFVERQEHSGPNGGPIEFFDINEWKRTRGARLKAVAALEE